MATDKVGFVKQHRSIMDATLWQWPATRLKIYMTIYLMVNWKECYWPYRGKVYHCLPGQTVTSYSKIAKACKSSDITPRIVRTTCRLLAEEGYITMETEYKSGIKITCLKWEREQGEYLPGEDVKLLPENTQRSQNRLQNRSQNLNPETTDIIEENGSDEKQRSQNRLQSVSTIEEDLKNKEEGKGSKDDPPSHSNVKILKAYYQLYQKYTEQPARVNFNRDSKILDNHNINEKETEQVINNLEQWYKNADSGTVKKLYPLGFFCRQYDEIDNIAAANRSAAIKDEYGFMSDIKCDKCGKELNVNRKGEPDPSHRCRYQGYCEECSCGWSWYEGEPEHKHDCKQYREQVNKKQGYQYFKDV